MRKRFFAAAALTYMVLSLSGDTSRPDSPEEPEATTLWALDDLTPRALETPPLRHDFGLPSGDGLFILPSPLFDNPAISVREPYTPPDPDHGKAELRERLLSEADGKQYIALGDTDHRLREIHQFVAEEGTIKAMADAGIKHIMMEGPPEMQGITDRFAKGEIPERVFKAISLALFPSGWSTPSNEDAFLQTQADIIRLAAAHGMQVHFVDTYGIGEIKPERRAAYCTYMTSRVNQLADLLTDLHNAPPRPRDTTTPVYDGSLFSLEPAFPLEPAPDIDYFFEPEQVRLLLVGTAFMGAADPSAAQEPPSLDDIYADTTADGGLNSQMSRRLQKGDPHVAARIAEIAGDERCVILYGAGHFFRLRGDIDHALGDDNVFYADVFADLDAQFMMFEFNKLEIVRLLRPDAELEEPDAVICLRTRTWSQDGQATCYGPGYAPLTARGMRFRATDFAGIYKHLAVAETPDMDTPDDGMDGMIPLDIHDATPAIETGEIPARTEPPPMRFPRGIRLRDHVENPAQTPLKTPEPEPGPGR